MSGDETDPSNSRAGSLADLSRKQTLQQLGAESPSPRTQTTATDGGERNTRYIVGMEPGSAGVARRAADEIHRELDFGDIGTAISGRFSEEAVENLRNNPNVRYIEENGTMEALGEVVPYGLELTAATDAIDNHHRGDGVDIAIVDTGIDPNHETLAENIGDGWAATDAMCATDCSLSWFCQIQKEIDTCYEDWDDDNGHGTHVAGTTAAAMNNTGVRGVVPEATMHAVKVLDCCGSGSYDDVAAGIEWATDQGHDIINLSLGGNPDSGAEVVADAVQYAATNNVVLVGAAGNDGPEEDSVTFPASYEPVIAVSCTNEEDEIAEESSRGPEVELAAPGVDVFSAIHRDDYDETSGTSMSAPHVAGAAASVIEAGVDDREVVRSHLTDAADDIGLDATEQGAGRLNVYDALPEKTDIEVSTHLPSTETDTTAQLQGEVQDIIGTDVVEARFEYGPEGEELPNQTIWMTIEEPTIVSRWITGLEPETTYEFRLVARANDEEFIAQSESFVTEEERDLDVTLAVETQSATNISQHVATLQGELLELIGADDLVTGLWFEYGTLDDGLSQSTPILYKEESTEIHTQIDELDPDTTYEYRFVGECRETVEEGEIHQFTTEPPIEADVEMTESTDIGYVEATFHGHLHSFAGLDEIEVGFRYWVANEVDTSMSEQLQLTDTDHLKTYLKGDLISNEDRSFEATVASLEPATVYEVNAVAIHEEDDGTREIVDIGDEDDIVSFETDDISGVSMDGDKVEVGENATLDIAAESCDGVIIDHLWTDWEVVEPDLDGGTATDEVDTSGVYGIEWDEVQELILASVDIEFPTESDDSPRYTGGSYLVNIYDDCEGVMDTAMIHIE